MRFLLSLAMMAAATMLVCHGVFTDKDAATALAKASPTNDAELRQVLRNWPYGETALKVQEQRIALFENEEAQPADENLVARVWTQVEEGFHDTAPWIRPAAAAAVGLLGLLLAVLLPGTRFRGLAILFLLAGAAVASPSAFDGGRQREWINAFQYTEYAIIQGPRIAIGILLVGALALGCQRPRD